MPYSLWLMPEGLARRRLMQIVQELSKRHGGPEFPPHVTLFGNCEGQRDALIEKSKRVAASLHPFAVRLGTMGMTERYFRDLFVHVGPADVLRSAHRAACEILGSKADPHFMPHLSLLYGNHPRDLKELIMTGISSKLRVQFKVRSLYLLQTEGDVQNWQEVARFPVT